MNSFACESIVVVTVGRVFLLYGLQVLVEPRLPYMNEGGNHEPASCRTKLELEGSHKESLRMDRQ